MLLVVGCLPALVIVPIVVKRNTDLERVWVVLAAIVGYLASVSLLWTGFTIVTAPPEIAHQRLPLTVIENIECWSETYVGPGNPSATWHFSATFNTESGYELLGDDFEKLTAMHIFVEIIDPATGERRIPGEAVWLPINKRSVFSGRSVQRDTMVPVEVEAPGGTPTELLECSVHSLQLTDQYSPLS